MPTGRCALYRTPPHNCCADPVQWKSPADNSSQCYRWTHTAQSSMDMVTNQCATDGATLTAVASTADIAVIQGERLSCPRYNRVTGLYTGYNASMGTANAYADLLYVDGRYDGTNWLRTDGTAFTPIFTAGECIMFQLGRPQFVHCTVAQTDNTTDKNCLAMSMSDSVDGLWRVECDQSVMNNTYTLPGVCSKSCTFAHLLMHRMTMQASMNVRVRAASTNYPPRAAATSFRGRCGRSIMPLICVGAGVRVYCG